MDSRPHPPDRGAGVDGIAATLAVCALGAFAATVGVIGADALWLVALGERVAHGALPRAIPYATAPSGGWHDVPAGAELVFWALFHLFGGARGLVLAQAGAAALGLGTLAVGLRRESSPGAALVVPLLVLAGALPSIAVVSVALFSLALFPLLLALLEAQSRRPSRAVWFSVPLLALWGNLHGEVLAGWALLACYLLGERARSRPWSSLALLASATAALLANPALLRTPDYYRGVLGSAVARQGEGLWAPLGSGGFDLLLVAAAVVLAAVALAGHGRMKLWELLAASGLTLATVHVARTGVWLLFLLAYPAARGLRLGAPHRRVLVAAAATLAIGAVALIVHGPPDPGSSSLASLAARSGEPVLAEGILGQQVALAGGRVWLDNPLDAFRRSDQRLYLDWLDGRASGEAALAHATRVLVEGGSTAGRRAAHDARLVRLAAAGGAVLYRVGRAG